MKIKSLFFFLVLFRSLTLSSQSKIYTYIQTDKSYAGRTWCLDRIVDGRKDKSSIGTIYRSGLSIEHAADFKQTLPEELMYFFRSNFFCLRNENKLLITVKRFEIGHIVTNKKQDTGFVYLDLDFYKLKNDSVFFLYNYTKRSREASETVPTTHPDRMRRALLVSLPQLDAFFTLKLNDTSMAKSHLVYNKSLSDSLKQNDYGLTLKKFKQQDSIKTAQNLPSYYFFFLGSQANVCYTSLTVDINANLVFQLKKHPQYLLGIQANYFVYGILSKKLIAPNSTYSLFNYDIGIRLLKQIEGNVFLNINPQVMFGRETFTYYIIPAGFKGTSNPETYDFTGFQMDIGVYNFHPQKQGIYFGGDVFFRGTSSNMIESTAGLKFNIGIKF